uniref:Uncharacterized protein n=1 Tax=Eutreptiella gymnastica TaxID=73025 RepID=A0A7S4CWC4_9EUGL
MRGNVVKPNMNIITHWVILKMPTFPPVFPSLSKPRSCLSFLHTSITGSKSYTLKGKLMCHQQQLVKHVHFHGLAVCPVDLVEQREEACSIKICGTKGNTIFQYDVKVRELGVCLCNRS